MEILTCPPGSRKEPKQKAWKQPKFWSDAAVESLAAKAAAAVIVLAAVLPVRDDNGWVCRVAGALLGEEGLAFSSLGVSFYLIAERQIAIAPDCEDMAFACAHELGHWAWFELLRWRKDVHDLVQERFANAFARHILDREAWDFVSKPAADSPLEFFVYGYPKDLAMNDNGGEL